MRLLPVYRIEHAESGLGPYRHWLESVGKEYYEVSGMEWHNYSAIHPAPWQDIPEWESKRDYVRFHSMIFGFRSIAQVNKWFSVEERVRMRRDGFVLRKYYVEPQYVIHGFKQLVFRRPSNV